MRKNLIRILGLTFGILLLSRASDASIRIKPQGPDGIRALYLASEYTADEKKISQLISLIRQSSTNGIVIDFKDSSTPNVSRYARLVDRFRREDVYIIARIVTFQDTAFAIKNPDVALKTRSGDFWHSGKAKWRRYWLDPASEKAQEHNIKIAEQALDAGFDEIQFDYIRFPTDGNMENLVYPVFNPKKQSMRNVLRDFYGKIRARLKTKKADIALGIDLYGEVSTYGAVTGIGQYWEDAADFFDVLSPMAYPTHYRCKEFGIPDPSTDPYTVYLKTLKPGREALEKLRKTRVVIRPWIQDFTIRSIYACGPTVPYTPWVVWAQIQAARDAGISGFMLWNPKSIFTEKILHESFSKK